MRGFSRKIVGRLGPYSGCLMVWLFAIALAELVGTEGQAQPKVKSETNLSECPKPRSAPKMTLKDVYAKTPFKAGERATYEVTYLGVLAGYGTLEVRPPQKHQGKWHRVFWGEAKTGDWYKAFFVLHDTIMAISRPWDFGIAQFFIKQDEGKLFGTRFTQKKWLSFDHEGCKVNEKVVKDPEKPETEEFPLVPGAVDSLGVTFKLREKTFKVGETIREQVYTSGQNWWLTAEPLEFKEITVPAGTYKAAKLKLQTYLGKELHQKGQVYAYYDTQTPQRPLVLIEAEVKIGTFRLSLKEFKPGE